MSLFSNTATMRSLHLLEKGMDAATLRHKVIANNIANADTPNFKRSEVIFESQMRRTIESERLARQSEPGPLRQGHPLHRTGRTHLRHDAIAPTVAMDVNTSMRNDGNNVDPEDEAAKLVRNQLQYSLIADRLGGTFRQLNQLSRLA